MTDIVIDVNARTMFTAHRPGCRDLARARRAGLYIIDGIEPTAEAVQDAVYGGDRTACVDSDISKAPCLRN